LELNIQVVSSSLNSAAAELNYSTLIERADRRTPSTGFQVAVENHAKNMLAAQANL